MQYKALIFDLDGTAIPMRRESRPNAVVIEAVKKAQEKVFVSIATGRDYAAAQHILTAFGIDQPCILNGGTQLL